MEPSLGKPYAIFEKLFDPMLSGTIPIYLGPKNLKGIPSNCYISLNKKSTAKKLIKDSIFSLTNQEKEEYRKRIFKYLLSEKADKYRHSAFANFILDTLVNIDKNEKNN